MLKPSSQYKILKYIWGDQEGWVFLPWVDKSGRFHNGRGYEWPTDQLEIEAELQRHTDEDFYFTPGVFASSTRSAGELLPERCLWADLDESDPRDWPAEVPQPSIAWETSPGRFQCVWSLDEPLPGAAKPGRLNQRVTQWVEADLSGFDATQLLRVPGRRNHKPKWDTPPEGKVLWAKATRYSADDFAAAPAVQVTSFQADTIEVETGGLDRGKLLRKYKPKVSTGVKEALRSHDFTADRSAVLWRIISEFAEAGATLEELVVICEPLGWNKHDRRGLVRECTKALANIAERKDEEEPEPDDSAWGLAWINRETPRPRWLVKDIWTEGGCGFIAGEPKSYKSWLALDLALSVAMGSDFIGEYQATQKNVLYVQAEDSASLVKDRVELIMSGKGHPPAGRIHIQGGRVYWEAPDCDPRMRFAVQTGFVASREDHQTWLQEQIEKDQIALVVIDTLGTTAGEVDTDKASDLLPRLLNPLRKIAAQTKCAIAIVHHNRKRAQGSDFTRSGQDMLGSTALHAWVDCAMYASQVEPGHVRVRREAKLAMEHTFSLRIPQMGVQADGSRVVWEPDYSPGEDEPETTAPTSAGSSKAGLSLARQLAAARGARGWVYEDILDAHGHGSNTKTQISRAIENGYIALEDNRYYPKGEALK